MEDNLLSVQNLLPFHNLIPLKMAFINLEQVQFYHEPPTRKPRNALPRQDKFRVALANNSASKPAPLHSKADSALKRSNHSKGSIGITQHQGHDVALQHEDDTVGAKGRASIFYKRIELIRSRLQS